MTTATKTKTNNRTAKAANQRRPAVQAVRTAKGAKVDPLEALGINALAAVLTTSPDLVLVILATVMSAVAGPISRIRSVLGPNRVGDINLLLPECPLLRRTIAFLLEPLATMNRRLASNAAAYSPDALSLLATGGFAAGPSLKLSSAGNQGEVLARHQSALRTGHGPQLSADLSYKPETHRIEALSHPEVLVNNPRSRELTTRIDLCNARTGLIYDPQLGLERSGSDPHNAVNALADLLAGIHTDRRGSTPRTNSQLKARVIVHASDEDLTFIHDYGQRMLEHLLVLPTASAKASEDDPQMQAVQAFSRLYFGVLEQLLDLRRAGREPQLVLEDRAQVEFDRCLIGYQHRVDRLPAPGTSARALPSAILFSLGFLARALPPAERPDDLSLVSTAFGIAWPLLDQHIRQLTNLRTATLTEQRRLAAERIVAAVETKEQMTFRQICRTFHNGLRSKIEPIVSAMLRADLLVQQESGAYTAGPADLDDVEDTLVQIIREDVEREAQTGKSPTSEDQHSKKGQHSEDQTGEGQHGKAQHGKKGRAKNPDAKPTVKKISKIANPPADSADSADSADAPTGLSAASDPI